MTALDKLTKKIVEFRDRRDWKQFHQPKDLALSLMLEAAEVAEHFQWKSNAEILEYAQKHREEIGEELADVLYWVLLLAYELKIDLIDSFNRKMLLNEQKYPIEKSKGRHTKYDKL